MSMAPDISSAVRALHQGQLVACPTEAVWGLSCDPDNDEALANLIRLKQRDPAKGVIVVAASIDQLKPWLVGLQESSCRWHLIYPQRCAPCIRDNSSHAPQKRFGD